MITIHQLCEKAYHIDKIDVLELTHRFIPEIAHFSTDELFPDYPDEPFESVYPNCTPKDIFEYRLKPLFLIRLKLICERYPFPNLVLHLQTSPFHGNA